MLLLTSQANSDIASLSELTHEKGLRMVHYNIRSLLPKIDLIRNELVNKPCDIFSVSESWLHESIPNGLISIDGYTCVRQDRSTRTDRGSTKAGGGLCVYINSSLVFTEDLDLSINDSNLELLSITLIPESSRRVRIISIYRPPDGKIDSALSDISNIIEKSRGGGLRLDLVLMGDFNIDLLYNGRTCSTAKQFSHENGLQQLITSYT